MSCCTGWMLLYVLHLALTLPVSLEVVVLDVLLLLLFLLSALVCYVVYGEKRKKGEASGGCR